MMEYVSKRIWDLCAERNLAINQLARISNVPATTVKNILNGDSKNPGVITIQKICNGFGITIIDFFDTKEFREKVQKR